MNFKKLLSAVVASSAFAAASVSAAPITINVAEFGTTPAGTDGVTALLNMGINWTATSVYTDTNNSGDIDFGDLVVDNGNGSISYLNPVTNVGLIGNEAREGLLSTHNMVFDYSGLTGMVVLNDGAGGIAGFYGAGAGQLFIRSDDDMDGVSDLTDTLLMTLDVTGSQGTVGNFTLLTQVSYAMPNVFFYEGVTDFNDMVVALQVIGGIADFNNDPLVPTPLGGAPLQWSRTTDLNGNLEFNVPEPGVLALLGLGFAGLGVARRNKKSA